MKKCFQTLLVILLLTQLLPSAIADYQDTLLPSIDTINVDALTEVSSADDRNNAFWSIVNEQQDSRRSLYRQWSLEEQVWVTSVEQLCQADALEVIYLLPDSSDLSQEQVISIAKQAVAEAFGWDEEELTPYQISFQMFKDETEPLWYVSFVEGGYVLMDCSGTVTKRENHNKLLPSEQFAQDGAGLTLTLAEEQTENQIDRLPVEVQAALDPRWCIAPDERHIPQEEAEEIASLAILDQYGMDAESFYQDYYVSSVKLSRYNRWSFTFYANAADFYRVEIDALTGEVLQITDPGDNVG